MEGAGGSGCLEPALGSTAGDSEGQATSTGLDLAAARAGCDGGD